MKVRSVLLCLATTSIQWGSLSAFNNLPSVSSHRSSFSTLNPLDGNSRNSVATKLGVRTAILPFDVTKMIEAPLRAAAAIALVVPLLAHPSSALASNTTPLLNSFATCRAENLALEKWDNVRFLEEQESGRLAKVVYSPDGKFASGADVDGNEFVASLQSDESIPVAILAPVLLVGIGALAFSKSSEGRAIQAATGLIGDDYQKTVAPGMAVKVSGEGEEEDRSFQFESLKDEFADESETTPEYILSSILAGSYYLPPESLLRTQSSAGRRIRYESLNKLDPLWVAVEDPRTDSPFESIMCAEIARLTFNSNKEPIPGLFRLFKLKLKCEVSGPLNMQLAQGAIKESKACEGIAVSNAGGFHSTKNFFANSKDRENDNEKDPSISAMCDIALQAVTLAERTDARTALSHRGMQGPSSDGLKERAFRPSGDEEESWTNINRNGHWNRLHTHTGASWSGVYYIKSDKNTLLRKYSGRLLLKPTSHPLEGPLWDALSNTERERLFAPDSEKEKASFQRLNVGVCDYLEIIPEEGSMILMPSWLHHGVTPLSVKQKDRAGDAGVRISLAFNFNEI